MGPRSKIKQSAYHRASMVGGKETEDIGGEKWTLVKELILEHYMPGSQS